MSAQPWCILGPVNITIVIPCYRSEATLRPVVTSILEVLTDRGHQIDLGGFELILVVDGSPDRTGDVAKELAAEHPEVRAVILRRNYGQHNALLAGIARARHDVIVTMDDDLQHRADQVFELLRPIYDGEADLVYGLAREEEHGVLRSAASRLVKRSLASTGVPHAGSVSAFRAFKTSLREGFNSVEDPYVSLDVLLSWTTTAVERVWVSMDRRTIGSSSYTVAGLVRHSMNMVTGYSNLPLRMVAWLGWFSAALGAVLGVIVVWKFAAGDTTVAGYTTTAAMIALFSGAQMLSLGIIGEYLGRLHTRSMGKPSYLVREEY